MRLYTKRRGWGRVGGQEVHMRALAVLAVFALLVIGSLATPVASQTTDAWIGTWTLNLAQSSYDPATPCPKESDHTHHGIGRHAYRGYRWRRRRRQEDSHGDHVHVRGKDYEYTGALDANSARAFTRVDDHHYSYSTKVNGAITTTSRVAVTPDGKRRTITTTGRDAQGRVIRNFSVWNRAG